MTYLEALADLEHRVRRRQIACSAFATHGIWKRQGTGRTDAEVGGGER